MIEETPFRSIFTKKSNFLTQSFVTDPVNIQYGSSGKFIIPRHGDFITRLYLLVDYESTKSTRVNQAHAMLEYVEIVIGGITVQRETGETLNMRLNLNTIEQQRFGIAQLYRMLGGGPNYPFTDVAQYERPYRLAIPVDFWFHGKTELAFPLAALRWQEVEVNVGFRNSDRWGGVDDGVKGSKVRLQIEYGYVNEEVRRTLMKRTYIFPTEQFQVQQSPFYEGDEELQFPPRIVEENTGSSFVNPVKALFVIYRSKENETSYIFDYSRGYSVSELTNSDGNDFLRNMEVELDGETLLPSEVGTPEFLRGFQYYAHFPGSTQNIDSGLDRYFSYIYALALCKDPMSRTKLNGGINFTAVKRPLITLKSKGNGVTLKTTKVVSAGTDKTILVPDTTDLEVGQYVRGLNIINDCRVSVIAPSGTVFYGKNGSLNVTLESNTVAGYCVPGAKISAGSFETTINSVNKGSGAKATIKYSALGSNEMSIIPTYSIPSVGDHITLDTEDFGREVEEVYGSVVINGSVLDKDSSNHLFFVGKNISTSGMFTSDHAVVQNYNENIEIVFGQVNDILGSVPLPTNVSSFELTDISEKPHLLNVLVKGTKILSDKVSSDATIDRIEGTTVYLDGFFLQIPTSIKLSVEWVTLDQNSTLASGSAVSFYPRVVFDTPSVTTAPEGNAVFGNKITLNDSLTEDLNSITLPDSVVLSKTLVNSSIQFSRNIYFYKSSEIIAKLYALSVNFIFIEDGMLELVYDKSNMTLPKFI